MLQPGTQDAASRDAGWDEGCSALEQRCGMLQEGCGTGCGMLQAAVQGAAQFPGTKGAAAWPLPG